MPYQFNSYTTGEDCKREVNMERKEDMRAMVDTEVEEKSEYELLRDARVAKLVERLKPVQMALDAL
jgi:hypothetical protein